MRVIRIIQSFLAACSFLTILPVPAPDWKEENGYFLCPMLPAVGAVLGVLWLPALRLLSSWSAAPDVLRGALTALYALALTGGLHMDGLMDTCDALFSRRDRETRLRILSDTHAGSFAVMGCASVLLLKTALFAGITRPPAAFLRLAAAALVPVWSRLGMAIMLNSMPFAHEGGLAAFFGANRSCRFAPFFAAAALLLAALSLLSGARFLPLVWAAVLLLWRMLCSRAFGGITGDLLGAFAELSETAMLFAVMDVTEV